MKQIKPMMAALAAACMIISWILGPAEAVSANAAHSGAAGGSVRLVRHGTGEAGDLLLGDAGYDLYAESGEKLSETPYYTDVAGTIVISGLSPGAYTLREIEAPYGYELAEPVSFSVKPQRGGDSAVLHVTGDPAAGEFVFRAVADAGEALADAVFYLYDLGGGTPEIAEKVRSDAEGFIRLTGLGPGPHRLVEVAPAIGRRMDTDGAIDIAVNGTSVTCTSADGRELIPAADGAVYLTRDADTGSSADVTVCAVNKNDGDTPVEGAVFSLSRWDGEVWTVVRENLTTDIHGLTNAYGLLPGRYRLTETSSAPDYMEQTGSCDFELDGTVFVETEHSPTGRITIEETDARDTALKLAGAAFTLYRDIAPEDPEGRDTRLEAVASGVTDEMGRLTFDGLAPGLYHLAQNAASTGYRRVSEPEMTNRIAIGHIRDRDGSQFIHPVEVSFEIQSVPENSTAAMEDIQEPPAGESVEGGIKPISEEHPGDGGSPWHLHYSRMGDMVHPFERLVVVILVALTMLAAQSVYLWRRRPGPATPPVE